MKAAVLLSVLLLACGGTTTSPLDDGGSDGSPGNDGSPGTDSGPSKGCPASPPQAGSACVTTNDGPKCEYGTNPDPGCNQMFVCVSNAWVNQTSGQICPPQSDCPASYAQVPNGQDCSPDQLACAYSQGECICTKDFGPVSKNTPAWDCIPATQGCPSPRPDIGTACSQPNQQCDYGACSGGVALTCTDGAWQQTFTPCPQ